MILKTLSLNNFKQYSQLDLIFNEGLVGIVGKNGAGKSSIFEAILLCLFGSNNTDKQFYKSAWAEDKDPVELSLSFEIDQLHYELRRSFRGKAMQHKAELFDHQQQLIATGASAVNEEVAKLLGMDKEAFTRSVFSGQKELSKISDTTGEERKKMVRKMIGLDHLDDIQKLIRADSTDIKRKIAFINEELLDKEALKKLEQDGKASKQHLTKVEKQITEKTTLLTKAEKTYEQSKKQFEQQLKKHDQFLQIKALIDKYQGTIDGFAENQKNVEAEIAHLQKLEKQVAKQAPQMAEYETRLQQKETLEKIKKQYDEQQQQLAEANRYREGLAAIEKNMAALDEQLKPLPELEKQLVALEDVLLKIQKNTQSIRQQQLQLQTEKGAIAGRINERRQHLDNMQQLGAATDCPTCFRPLAEVYEQTIKSLESEIKNYENTQLTALTKKLQLLEKQLFSESEQQEKTETDIKALQASIISLKKDADTRQQEKERMENGQQLLEELEKSIEKMGTIAFDPQQFEQLREKILQQQEAYITYRSQRDDLQQLPQKITTAEELASRIKNGKKEIAKEEKNLLHLQYDVAQYAAAKQEQATAEQTKNEAFADLENHKRLRLTTENELNQLEKQLAEQAKKREKIGTMRKERKELDTLVEHFGNFKTYILERVRPTIADEASQLFQRITEGRYEGIEVDDNFEFHIYENGQAYPITRFSGGEIDLANFCLRIGISKAIAELSGRSSTLGFLGFDEVFGSQDEDRRFGILHALELLSEVYRQIYIISHVDSVKEHFPAILQIRKTNIGSQAQWS